MQKLKVLGKFRAFEGDLQVKDKSHLLFKILDGLTQFINFTLWSSNNLDIVK